jgi:hypothetical protein
MPCTHHELTRLYRKPKPVRGWCYAKAWKACNYGTRVGRQARARISRRVGVPVGGGQLDRGEGWVLWAITLKVDPLGRDRLGET